MAQIKFLPILLPMPDSFIHTYRKKIATRLEPEFGRSEAEALSWLLLQENFPAVKKNVLDIKEQDFSSHHFKQIDSWIGELRQGRPWQYITGNAPFFGYDFFVDESVLIPRPETEELVDWIIRDQKGTGKISMLDIGTGSGCIPVVLKKKLPDADVFACDISDEALTVAKRNADKLNVSVHFQQVDILSAKPDLPQKMEVIVSNPPYIAEYESAEITRQVTEHEPHHALFVPDHDPLIFYRRIAELSLQIGKPGGQVYFEINERLGRETVVCLAEAGLQDIVLKKDMQKKNRVVRATIPEFSA